MSEVSNIQLILLIVPLFQKSHWLESSSIFLKTWESSTCRHVTRTWIESTSALSSGSSSPLSLLCTDQGKVLPTHRKNHPTTGKEPRDYLTSGSIAPFGHQICAVLNHCLLKHDQKRKSIIKSSQRKAI